MLARPTKSYAMVFDRFEKNPFTCEYKYDGERAQIHILPNGDIAIFSRNFENSTERFPDVKLVIQKAAQKAQVTSCIVDAEVVAIDKATNKRLPFQVLSTRSRKNVKVEEIKVPVCVYGFDLLFLNGKSLLTHNLTERRELLRQTLEETPGHFEFATSLEVDMEKDPQIAGEMEIAVDKVRNFLEEAVKENCEGLMVKTLVQEATYEPANRSHKWLKLKKDYLDGIGDSTDLVPIGAFYGKGKRTGVYGAYLLACYDPETEMYQCITKLGTGLSDELLTKFTQELKEKVIEKPQKDFLIGENGTKPDVWFEPSCVWEILGADLSISPKYTAAMGLVASDKGISLRFPRFLRTREDKNPTDATNAMQIADLYRAQGLATATTGEGDDEDDLLL
jgi:DNA ligase-1